MEKELTLNEIVAQNLILLRKKAGLTQQDLAKKLNYSDKTISKWELAYMIPSLDILLNLAEFYGVDLSFFVTKDHEGVVFNNEKKDKNKTNKVVILSLFVTGLWTIAAAVFAYIMITKNNPIWTIFLWCTVVSCFFVSIFIKREWGKLNSFFVFLSLFLWFTLVSAFVQIFISTGNVMWYLFFIGIPLQVAIILWRLMK